MRLSAVFQKKLYVRRIVRNSRGLRDPLSRSRAWRSRLRGESAGGRGRKPVVPRGGGEGDDDERGKGDAMRGYMGCRRIVASVLRVLIWRHSASVPSGVARTLLVSSRTRQSPGFNIKPPRSFSLAWALFLFPLPLHHAGYPFEDPDDGFSTRANWWRVSHYRLVNRSA